MGKRFTTRDRLIEQRLHETMNKPEKLLFQLILAEWYLQGKPHPNDFDISWMDTGFELKVFTGKKVFARRQRMKKARLKSDALLRKAEAKLKRLRARENHIGVMEERVNWRETFNDHRIQERIDELRGEGDMLMGRIETLIERLESKHQ